MKMIGIARIGRDAELRFIPSGEAVINLSLAFNYGKKGEDGNRPTTWIDATLWGKRAESLVQYLVKGQQVCATLSEAHIETYEGKNGTASKLVARVDDIEFAGSPPQQNGQQAQGGQQRSQGGGQQQRPAQGQNRSQGQQRQQPQRQAPRNDSGFDDMSDDIPF